MKFKVGDPVCIRSRVHADQEHTVVEARQGKRGGVYTIRNKFGSTSQPWTDDELVPDPFPRKPPVKRTLYAALDKAGGRRVTNETLYVTEYDDDVTHYRVRHASMLGYIIVGGYDDTYRMLTNIVVMLGGSPEAEEWVVL